MSVNVWAQVGAVIGYLPLSALTGNAGQLLGMDSGGTVAEWKNFQVFGNQMRMPAGSAGSPALVFQGGTATGWYKGALGDWTFAILGLDVLVISNAAGFQFTNRHVKISNKLLQTDLGGSIAAAATTDLGNATGNTLDITNAAGATVITSLGGASIPAGTQVETKFVITGGSITITYDAANLILLGGADISIITGDVARWRKINDAAARWEMVSFNRGTSAGSAIAAKGDLIAGVLNSGNIIPGILTVGSNGQTIVPDSTQAAGLRWVDKVSSKNLLINGNFDVWQRGLSFLGVSTAPYAADRWFASNSAGTLDVTRVAATGLGVGNYGLRVRQATGVSSISLDSVQTTAFTNNVKGKTLIFSGYIRKGSTFLPDVNVLLFTAAAEARFSASVDINSLVIPNAAIPGAASAPVRFSVALSVPANSAALGFTVRVNAVGVVADANAYFEVFGCKLQEGNFATPLDFNSFESEWANCLDYYEKSFDYATAPAQNAGVVGAHYFLQPVAALTATATPPVKFERAKRITPLLVTYNPQAANAEIRTEAIGDWTLTTPAIIAQNGFRLTGTTPAGTAVNQGCSVHWTADAEIY